MGPPNPSHCLSLVVKKSYMKTAGLDVHKGTVFCAVIYANRKNKENGRLAAALSGCIKEHHRFNLQMAKAEHDLLVKQAEEYQAKIDGICQGSFPTQQALLKTIPGVSRISSAVIIAETGADMKDFDNSAKLSGWIGLRPKNDESAGKYKSTAITRGNLGKNTESLGKLRKVWTGSP